MDLITLGDKFINVIDILDIKDHILRKLIKDKLERLKDILPDNYIDTIFIDNDMLLLISNKKFGLVTLNRNPVASKLNMERVKKVMKCDEETCNNTFINESITNITTFMIVNNGLLRLIKGL